jgi:hypothetical protein
MKNLQEEKQARQDQLDPFQQQAKGMIDEIQIEKGIREQELSERRSEVLKEHMKTWDLETLAGKSAQAKEKSTELGKKFHALDVVL